MNTVAALLLLCLIPECSLEDDCPGTYQYVDACSSCSDGYGLLADPTTGCAECPSHCSNCEENSGSMACVQCSSQYGLNTDSGCQQCTVSNCNLCTFSASGQEDCTLCQSYYALVNGQCQSADYCTAISISGGSFTCTACDSGFYATSGRCQACPRNCSSCSANDVCTQCDDGFGLSTDGSCSACQSPRQQCVFVNGTEYATACDASFVLRPATCQAACTAPYCMCCSDATPSQCSLCLKGYGFVDDVCQVCPDNCKYCTSGMCSSCNSGYVLESGVCYACPSNCTEGSCNASVDRDTGVVSIACSACETGFVISGSTDCISCSGCAVCTLVSGSTTQCQTDNGCVDGYYLNAVDGTCTACAANGCSDCPEGTCVDCSDGYALNPTNASCTACLSNCNNCTYDGSSLACTTCDDGYYTISGACQACPLSGCRSCRRVNNEVVCLACYADQGLSLESARCQSCPSPCQSCTSVSDSETECSACADGYIFLNGACTACSTVVDENCATCHLSGSSAVCDTCQSEFSITSDSTCMSCADFGGCLGCGNVTICQCPDGYLLKDNACVSTCFSCGNGDWSGSCGGGSHGEMLECNGTCWVGQREDIVSTSYQRTCSNDTCSSETEIGTCVLYYGYILECWRCCDVSGCNTFDPFSLNILSSDAASTLCHVTLIFVLSLVLITLE